MSVFYYPTQAYAHSNFLWQPANQYVTSNSPPSPTTIFHASSQMPVEHTIVSQPFLWTTATSSPVVPAPLQNDVSLKAAVEVHRREAMDPEQVELRLMETMPKLQSPEMKYSRAVEEPVSMFPNNHGPRRDTADIFVSQDKYKSYTSPYLDPRNQGNPPAAALPPFSELERRNQQLEEERRALQAQLLLVEAGRQASLSAQVQSAQQLDRMQSSVAALQQSLSHQALQLGAAQQQLAHQASQHHQATQAWAAELQAAREQLRRQRADHTRELEAVRGRSPPPSLHQHRRESACRLHESRLKHMTM
jgi:hypothetical protein